MPTNTSINVNQNYSGFIYPTTHLKGQTLNCYSELKYRSIELLDRCTIFVRRKRFENEIRILFTRYGTRTICIIHTAVAIEIDPSLSCFEI